MIHPLRAIRNYLRHDKIRLGAKVWHDGPLGCMGMVVSILPSPEPGDDVLSFSHHRFTLPRNAVTTVPPHKRG
jgi:hypothetical protein